MPTTPVPIIGGLSWIDFGAGRQGLGALKAPVQRFCLKPVSRIENAPTLKSVGAQYRHFQEAIIWSMDQSS